ncbi:MAG: GxxExxY protein [Bacteroidetes bacterium GWF2_42_66]|nr:MAG: GxxExxY protein [Bacteroidetes bacterium GWA2_42_15]OFY02213.1 MAG: GxxExxY protein [Bacteroidetes bacterium GWE2_42_39]OFY43660.1 MAG: GxxExxY protein [Bacteroidetes bacterium GWF2_42_66]HBL75295.1 GxxExxY protein [Prolixibacteraceae bacterium]HCR90426.1 GxxExxY protein [Prolixibacteraceae bacterium]
MVTQKQINDISRAIIGYAIEVHKELGPGLLESIYEKCLTHLLTENGFKVERQRNIPLTFRSLNLDCELRFDLLVNDLVIVELKTVEFFSPIHEAQLLTYLKLLRKPKGILINFNCINIFKEGQRTFVTEYFKDLPKE